MIRKCWKIGVKIISSCVRCGARDFAVPWTRVTRVMYWPAGFDSACLSSNSTGRICTYVSTDPSWRGLVFFIRKPGLVQNLYDPNGKVQNPNGLFGNQSNIQNPTGGFCAWGTPTGNLDHYAIWRGVFDSPGPSIFCAHLFSGSATWKSEVALRLWDGIKYEYATRLWMWACLFFVFHVLHGIIPW